MYSTIDYYCEDGGLLIAENISFIDFFLRLSNKDRS